MATPQHQSKGAGGEATHTEAPGENGLKDVVQETIEASRLPGLTCGARVHCRIYLWTHSQHPANLCVPYLGGCCRAVLGLDLEGVLGAGREPEHQGLEGCSQLCRRMGLVKGTTVAVTSKRGAEVQVGRWETWFTNNIYAPHNAGCLRMTS